ncbi:MAG TPA: LUD domain-containing protein [Bacteroidia bacterium]|jgi:L-lactate dehydrogenase complex protein LldG|nr:LUD domain-containing protein [Bacteroidia bacterium]
MSDSTTSKEKILKKIRKALIHKSLQEIGDVNTDADIFTSSEDPLELQFAQNFVKINGKFVFCEDENDFLQNLSSIVKDNKWEDLFCLEPEIKSLLKKASIPFSDQEDQLLNANIGLTFCECLIARTGSVIISSKQASGRRLPVYSNYHIVIAYTSQLFLHVKDGLKHIREKYNNQLPSMIATITGPSRTADIEKTLVQGAHGPKEIFVFLIDNTPLESNS